MVEAVLQTGYVLKQTATGFMLRRLALYENFPNHRTPFRITLL